MEAIKSTQRQQIRRCPRLEKNIGKKNGKQQTKTYAARKKGFKRHEQNFKITLKMKTNENIGRTGPIRRLGTSKSLEFCDVLSFSLSFCLSSFLSFRALAIQAMQVRQTSLFGLFEFVVDLRPNVHRIRSNENKFKSKVSPTKLCTRFRSTNNVV